MADTVVFTIEVPSLPAMYKISTDPEEKKKKQSKEKEKEDVEKAQEETEKEKMLRQKELEEQERLRLERRKRTQEDLVKDFVTILENMMNPRQALTSMMSALAGIISFAVGVVFIVQNPEHALKANELAVILIGYGVLQILLATTYFVTCVQTSIAVTKGVEDTFQIVVGVIIAGIYVIFAFVSLIIGLYGFYKTLALCSSVDYFNPTSPTYVPKTEFCTCLTVFVFHIITILLKCCCCK
ncbi:hypothetical protein PENTCL1PPCAC_12265 [Pristionchus entomophagus]|uniref:MARVEL domain-containing protein n=1 Tax=Pristionchus entomophagus TaxID=358040 RepID=A0AAV5TCE6_9BILA|nr:hypothetical protein PENTCL1PPCAC_12265 [Pristionchus entomophagus]